ncbi:MAG: cytochrome c oxidase, cbb3-type, CcoQ subunit [Hydrogenimonas sp.]|nr:MAG: cytochrome c oxidase, cbb3-type, CcoQ subunit [Hydrogenimonas sp.]
MENIRELQAYGYFFFTLFLVVVLYAYILHLYRAEKKGTRNYEKYGKLALDDEIDATPVEPNDKGTDETKENKEQS